MSTVSSGSTSSLSSSPYSAFSSSLLRPSFRSSLELDPDQSELLENQETLFQTAASLLSRSSSPPTYQYPPPKPAWQTREVADSVLRMEMMLIEAVQEMRMKNWGKKKKKSGSGGSSGSRKKHRRRARTPEPEPEPEPQPSNRTDRESKTDMYTEYGTTIFDSEAEEIVLQAQWRQLMKNPNAQIRPLRRFSMTTRTSDRSDRTTQSQHPADRTQETWTSYGDGFGPAYTENTGRATGGYRDGYGTAVQTPMTMPRPADQYTGTQSLGGYSPGTVTISYVTPSPATGAQQEIPIQPMPEPQESSSALALDPEAGPEEEIEMSRGRKRTPKGSMSSMRS